MIDTDKYEGHTPADEWESHLIDALFETEFPMTYGDNQLMADAPLLLAEVIRLREDYEKMSEVLRQHGMDICRHCRVIYRDDDMNHPHYPSLHPWHMDGMCMTTS